jgi:hypothetical protein
MKTLMGLAIAFGLSMPAVAADSFYHGYITSVGVLGNGDVFIEFPEAIGPSANCTHAMVRIAATNATRKEILAVALTAYTSGTRLYLQTDNCYGGFPTMTGSGSFIYPKP